jgi:hypothetical protein
LFSYPNYQRSDNGTYVEKSGTKLNNQWVVPHNLYLATKYNAHINVEICNTIGAVKYLFKYVYKGIFRLFIKIIFIFVSKKTLYDDKEATKSHFLYNNQMIHNSLSTSIQKKIFK